MTDPMQDPPGKRAASGLFARFLRAIGRFVAAFVGHILMHVVIGLLIGLGLYFFTGLGLLESLGVGIAIIFLMILIGAAGS